MKTLVALHAAGLAALACVGTAQAPAPNGRCYAFALEAPGLSVTADDQGRWFVSDWRRLEAIGDQSDQTGCVARRLIALRSTLTIRMNDVARCFMRRDASDELAERAIADVVHPCGFSRSVTAFSEI